MREDARRTLQDLTPTTPAKAIRTPEEFIAALERANVVAEDPTMSHEFDRLAAAVRSAPFLIQAGRVVAKGFTPRLIA